MKKISLGIGGALLTLMLAVTMFSCAAAPPPEEKPAGPQPFTTPIRITSDPTGVAVYANGEFWGKTPYEGTIQWMAPDQNIELRFEATGYVTERRMITPNQKNIHVVLQPSAAAPR